MRRLSCLAAVSVLTAGAAAAAPPPYHPPEETAALTPGPGSNLVFARCVVCHSVDYITTQPHRTVSPAFWQTEVAKMAKSFGANVPDEERQAIVDYLNRTYGIPPAGK